MLIIREVLTAKPGQASKLAKLFKKVFGSDPNPENVFVRLTRVYAVRIIPYGRSV